MKTAKTTTSKSDGSEGAQAPFIIRLPLNPVPASRPRVSRWGTYYAKTYKNWMAEAAKLLAKITPCRMDGPLHVSVMFCVQRPKTTERAWPRGDIDNYLKAIYDAITKSGVCWHDDDQIVSEQSVKLFSPGEPMIALAIYNAEEWKQNNSKMLSTLSFTALRPLPR